LLVVLNVPPIGNKLLLALSSLSAMKNKADG
jgi:hypothetical protein